MDYCARERGKRSLFREIDENSTYRAESQTIRPSSMPQQLAKSWSRRLETIKLRRRPHNSGTNGFYGFDRNRLFFAILFALLLTAHLFIILFQRLFPYVDVPFHLATATIYKHIGDSDAVFSQYYFFQLFPMPNILHMLFCAAPVFPTVEIGNKVFFLLYVLLLPVLSLILIKWYKGDYWFSLLPFILIYNFNLYWGLAGYTIAIVLLLIFLLTMEHYYRSRSSSLAALLIAQSIIIFLAHAQAAMFCLVVFYTAWILDAFWNKKTRPAGLLIGVPLILLILYWIKGTIQVGGGDDLSYMVEYYFSFEPLSYIRTFWFRLWALTFQDNQVLLPRGHETRLGMVFGLIVLFPFILSLCEIRRLKSRFHVLKNHIPLVAFFIAALGCFLTLPHMIPNQSFIFERFSVFVLLGAIFLSSMFFRDRKSIFAVIIVAAAVAHFVLWYDFHRGFDHINKDFTGDFFPEVEEGRLAGIIRAPYYQRNASYIHFPNYFTVWKNGISASINWQARFGSIRKRDGAKIPKYREWTESWKNDGRYTDIDFILVRGAPDESDLMYLSGFRLTRHTGEWSLYSNMRNFEDVH